MSEIYRAIFKVTEFLPLIDTHEHMERTAEEKYPGGDLFDILKNTFYLWADLVSSGMPPEPWSPTEEDDEKKWQAIRDYLPNVVSSGYYRGILRGLKAIHGFEYDLIDNDNWRSLNDRIRSAYQDPLWPEKVLRDETHIQWLINDVDGFNMNRSLFLPALKFDYLLRGNTEAGRKQIQEMERTQISTFDDYLEVLDNKIDEFKNGGAVALKTVTPYYRNLDYEEVSESTARRAFQNSGKSTPEQQRVVEDFAFHFVIRKAVALNLPVQIHTGLLAWNTTYLPHCNPVQLNHLFLRYPQCRFVLFHGGYPFADETGVLAKTFPNVFLDFCWLPWISFHVTKRFLHDWLELVPINKLMWGGDAHRAECVHGHWLLAQQVVSEVLSEKVQGNFLDVKSAIRIAKAIFRNNAIRFFELPASEN